MQVAPPETTARHSGYRPDIDGLRAVAVLLVLFDHVGVRRLAGGYIGVDVFFVISGYLISSLLLKEIDAGKFSLARFYERRFRRIMPALLAMLAAVSMLAYRYLFPPELKGFAATEVGSLLSFSNIVLWQQAGYFDAPFRLRPLLHTWSLGVEEQFYIVFPLFLYALCRFARARLKTIIWTLTAAIFLLAWYWTGVSATTAFFLAPLRAWELLVGTLLALKAFPHLNTPLKRDLATAAGLFLILAAALHFNDGTKFPGFAALWPCVGAALIIAAGDLGSSPLGRILAWAPIRWIGLISYSLYLWHWPLQVFQTTNAILVPDRYPAWIAESAVVLGSFVIAALSWKFVEQPFRTGAFRKGRIGLIAINSAVFAAVLWFSAMLWKHGGWPPASVPRSAAYYDFARADPGIANPRWGDCYLDPENFPASFNQRLCLAEDPTRKQYLLLGDSHAAAIYPGLRAEFPELNLSQLNTTGCKPLMEQIGSGSARCGHVSDFVYGNYLLHHHVDTVLLVGRWAAWDLDNLTQTIAWIRAHGMRPIVFGPSIEFDRSLVRLLEVSHRDHDAYALARHRVAEPEQLDQRWAALARDQWKVPYISMYEDLCTLPAGSPENASGCPVYAAPDTALLWDTDHLSPAGARLFAQSIRAHQQLP